MSSLTQNIVRKFKLYLENRVFSIFKSIKTRFNDWSIEQEVTRILSLPNFVISQNVVIEGVPTILLDPLAMITLDDGVMLNSNQNWCLLATYAPVILIANHPNAKIRIGSETRLHGSCIRAYRSVTIGKRCLIASNCQITDASGHSLSFPDVENRIHDICMDSSPVVLEDDVWLCEGVKVLPGVTIGKGSVVGAGSVVTKSLPPNCLAGGIPAKVIQKFQ